MQSIVMTLIFSIVMLLFMAFPAIKVVEWISNKKELSQKNQNRLTIFFTILFSLIIGIFLQVG